MIIGVILDNNTPVIELKVRGAREESTIEGILDTGFNGFVCLPTSRDRFPPWLDCGYNSAKVGQSLLSFPAALSETCAPGYP